MICAPLEQFEILLIYHSNFFIVDFSITNFLLISLLILFIINIIIFLKSVNKNKFFNFYFIPNVWQKIIELVTVVLVIYLLSNSITKDNEKFFVFMCLIFNFILFSNIFGLIPYSFTLTSHLFITFLLSFSTFIGINLITIRKYGLKMVLLFFPPNSSIYLAIILVPIELISYIAKPISLGVRLFINLMAGHALLKVIIGFSWELLEQENFSSLYLLIPMLILTVLFCLELSVALIQTYVFIILTCIYVQDGS